MHARTNAHQHGWSLLPAPQAEPHRQLALLQEAAACLAKAQEQEDALFAAAQPEQRGKATGPLQPKVRAAWGWWGKPKGCVQLLRCAYACGGFHPQIAGR